MQNILNINAYIQIYNTHIYTYKQKMELLEVAAAAETDNLTQKLSTATERVDALQKETLALKVSLFISACHTFSFIYIVHTYIHVYKSTLSLCMTCSYHIHIHTCIHTYIHTFSNGQSQSFCHTLVVSSCNSFSFIHRRIIRLWRKRKPIQTVWRKPYLRCSLP